MPINTAPHIHHLIVCANIFVKKDGKYLLLRRSPNKKYAPNVTAPIGGKVDPNEDPYMAAKREVLEEAGIEVKNMRLEAVILEIKPIKDEDENWLIFHFSADYESGTVGTTEEGEFCYLTRDEMKQEKFFASAHAALPYVLNPKDGTVFMTVSYDHEKGTAKTESLNICKLND